MSVPSRWLPAAALLLLTLAGCGGSSPDAAAAGGTDPAAAAADPAGGRAGDCAKGYGVTVCFRYELTGAVTAAGTLPGLVGTNNGTDYATCADWAKGEPGGDDGEPRLAMPAGGQVAPGDTFGGLTGNIIVRYRGPGTYAKKDLSGQGSPSGIITPGSTRTFLLVEDSAGSATVNADGSGSFTFDKLGTGQYGHPETVSGTVTWTCHNP